MGAVDDIYMARVRQRNAKLFTAKRIVITVESLEAQLRAAFDAGHAACYTAGTKAAATGDAMFDALFRTPGR